MSPDEDRFRDCKLDGSTIGGRTPRRMNAFYTSAVGNIKVAVPEHQFEDAMTILQDYRGRQGLDPNYGSPSAFG